MDQFSLGPTKLPVSRICLGTMTFGAQSDESTAASLVDLALERGINFIDTANKYSLGTSEEILGRLLVGRRDSVVLASKVHGRMGEGADMSGLSAAAVVRAIDDSLRRLQTDYLDVYYLHQPDYDVPLAETLEAMDRLVRAGKVRQVGLSNYSSWQLCQALWLAERSDAQPVTVVQPMYNLLARRIESELLPMCREFGIAMVVYNPLAGGLLTGKHSSAVAPQQGTRFDGNQQYLDRYWNAANFAAVEDLRRLAQDCQRSLISVALGWLLHHTPIDGVILGASTLTHLRDNLDALEDGPLPEEIVAGCEAVGTTLLGASPAYHR